MATATKNKKPAAQSRPSGLLTWIAVGVVLVAILGFVVVKITSTHKAGPSSAISATLAKDLTTVPASVFDTVGITSPSAAVTPPTIAKNQALLTTTVNGAKLPQVIYYGAEYCPFCAAQRWSTIVALSRFGTFSGLRTMSSSPTDVYANTPTFTFLNSTYKSKYVAFTSVEVQDVNHKTLQVPTALETKLITKYDNATYFPSLAGQQGGSIPFMTFGNQFLVAGASFNPGILVNLTREQIAAGLATTSSPITQAIIASANYQTAAICKLTGGNPGSVCTSPGVKAAATKMGI